MVRTKQTTARVTLPNDREVRVTRDFRAPRSLVYEAYTNPDLVRRWLLGPPGWSMPVCEMDVREGGQYRWHWRADDGSGDFGFHGEFLEVEPGARLRHTEHFDPGTTGEDMGEGHAEVTVTFEAEGDVTTVTTLISYASQADRDAAVATGMTDGMEMSYEKLDALVAEAPSG